MNSAGLRKRRRLSIVDFRCRRRRIWSLPSARAMALSSGGPKGQRGRGMAEMHRIAVVGLGMALKPHLQSLRELSLSGRVEIAACYTPSEERREAFGRDNPD